MSERRPCASKFQIVILVGPTKRFQLSKRGGKFIFGITYKTWQN